MRTVDISNPHLYPSIVEFMLGSLKKFFLSFKYSRVKNFNQKRGIGNLLVGKGIWNHVGSCVIEQCKWDLIGNLNEGATRNRLLLFPLPPPLPIAWRRWYDFGKCPCSMKDRRRKWTLRAPRSRILVFYRLLPLGSKCWYALFLLVVPICRGALFGWPLLLIYFIKEKRGRTALLLFSPTPPISPYPSSS